MTKRFSKVAAPFCIPTCNKWELLLLHNLTSTWHCHCSGFSILISIEGYLIILVCIFLMAYNTCFLSIYLIQWTIYSGLWPVFRLLVFSLLDFKSSLNLWLFYQIWFANIFFPSMTCLLNLLIVSFFLFFFFLNREQLLFFFFFYF